MSETKDPYIAALLREREGYVQFDKPDRVAAVDAELVRRGYVAPEKVEPKSRGGRPSRTADSAKPASSGD